MTTGVRNGSMAGRLWPLAAVAILLAWACLAQVQSGPQEPAKVVDKEKEPEKLPEGVSKITKEHLLTKVPNFFCFEYEFPPVPGKRLWMRVDDKTWIERYPDGSDSKYKILGRMKISGENGTVVAKFAGDLEKTGTPNDGTFFVFIPDKSNVEMVLRTSHTTARNLAGQTWKSAELEKIE
jgi:hypothetical protein